jgi:hypothetical protein
LSGTYWSELIVQVTNKRIDTMPVNVVDPVTHKKRIVSMGVRQNYRYVFTIVTQIQNTGIRKMNIKNIKLLGRESGTRNIHFEIENTGERGFFPNVWVELFNNSTGMKIFNGDKDRFGETKVKTFPGSCVPQDLPIENVPSGQYKALVYTDAGEEDLFAFQFDLKTEQK